MTPIQSFHEPLRREIFFRVRSSRISAPPPGSESHDLVDAEARHVRHFANFRRRERVHRNRREPLLNAAQQVGIVRERKVRVRTALHEDFRAADVDRLLDFLIDRLVRQHVAFFRARRPIERAEPAIYVANVRIVHIPADHERRNRLGMKFLHDLIGGRAHLLDFVGSE